MSLRRFLRDSFGTASVEFALIAPLMIVLIFAGAEGGHFVWTQHKLADAVRDGARYASRLEVDKVCDGATSVLADDELANIKNVTRFGRVDGAGLPVVPGWADSEVVVEVSCQSFVSTGIYESFGEAGPVVTVRAVGVTYPSFVITSNVPLFARSNAAVIGL
jgi:Flp pilus assembly pilin Flp